MDDRVQSTYHSALDDQRGRTKCNAQICRGFAVKAGYKQFLRRYVQGV